MPEIKTREVVKGTIKTLDKAAIAGERMKDAYVRTKEKAAQTTNPTENSPEVYAADRISGTAEAGAIEGIHLFDGNSTSNSPKFRNLPYHIAADMAFYPYRNGES